jgi:ribonuclease E
MSNEPEGGSSRPLDDARASTESHNSSGGSESASQESADSGGVGKPKIGDSRPAPKTDPAPKSENESQPKSSGRRRRRGGRRRSGGGGGGGRQKSPAPTPVEAVTADTPVELDEDEMRRRSGRARKGQPVGRYTMCVGVRDEATQIAILEGRRLIEHYVSRPADDVTQIHGNIYLGRVQNVLPGMEAAFVDIGTPKNAVLYRGDVQFDPDDVDSKSKGKNPRIEELLKNKQTILCQVTKNPIAHKGARLTQEVSLPGRFVVLVPNSKTFGISKRLPESERKRLRKILDKAKPKQHGVIVRTAAEEVTGEEIEKDVRRLISQWEEIEKLASKTKAPALLYREPDMAVRVIREEFTKDYRGVIIDDKSLYEDVNEYVSSITPALSDRVQFYDSDAEDLPLMARYHISEQLRKALDAKVWLPSGGSLIIEHTEALTVIDVNTGKNVGSSSLEETVLANNLEAAEEIARELRLRDIGGIIVIDFVDMEVKANREQVSKVFRDALAQDKTRTQVFAISDLGLVEMTRKRIGEGLIESFSHRCETCDSRGFTLEEELLDL